MQRRWDDLQAQLKRLHVPAGCTPEALQTVRSPVNSYQNSYRHPVTFLSNSDGYQIPIKIISNSDQYQNLIKFLSNSGQYQIPNKILSNSYQNPNKILSHPLQAQLNRLHVPAGCTREARQTTRFMNARDLGSPKLIFL